MLAPGGVSPALVRRARGGRPLWRGLARRRASPPGRCGIVKADVVGNGHVRVIVAGDDGRRVKAIAFRMADSPLGQALLAAPPHRKLWLAGRIKTRRLGQRARGRAASRGRRLGRLT